MAEGFLLRADPDLLDQARKAALAEGISVSDLIRQGIELRLAQGGFTRPETREGLLAEIERIARLLRAGHVLVPAHEVLPSGPPDAWTGMMEPEGP
jgi:hypothetical protein